jgi:cyclopropane fatty-acyl-phospholipid synthase-like methyltransferase
MAEKCGCRVVSYNISREQVRSLAPSARAFQFGSRRRIDKYIFPNGMAPSVTQLGEAMEHQWVVEDWHNFGPNYDRTLLAWGSNFDRAWPALREKYCGRF